MADVTETVSPLQQVANPSSANSMVSTASAGNPLVAQMMQNMLNRDTSRASYLEKQQAAYNSEMEDYANRVAQARTPEANEAQMWGAMSNAASSVAPIWGNLGQMIGKVGAAYGENQGQQRDAALGNQADLVKLRQAEVRALEAKDANAAIARSLMSGQRGTWQTKTLDDGSVLRWHTGTGEEKLIPATKSKDWASARQQAYDYAAKNNMPNPEEYAEQYADKVAGVSPRQPEGIAPIQSMPGTEGKPEVLADNAENPNLKFDVSGLSPEDKAQVQRLIARYQANPNEGTKAQTAKAINQLMSKGSIKPITVTQPAATTPSSLDYTGKPKQEGAIESSKEGAKMYADSFKTNVLDPLMSFQDTGKIMQDFNVIGEMNGALKNGKLKEFMAGDTGKTLLSVLPANSDLRKGIANAQEAEKLTAGMVNKILLAAKGVQTEGDADRARSQVTSIGADPEANKYLEAYVKETARQLKLREQFGLQHKKETGNWEGYDNSWQNSPIMKEARGSVKKLGENYIGLTQYMHKFKQKNPDATETDAIASWNKVK